LRDGDQTFTCKVSLNHFDSFCVTNISLAHWHLSEIFTERNDALLSHFSAMGSYLLDNYMGSPLLDPAPEEPYEFARWQRARYHVEFDKHYYSVPHTLRGKEVEIRATEKTVEIFYRRQRQASHARVRSPGRYSTQREHMPPAHQYVDGWSPERFLRWAEDSGPHTAALVAAVLDGRRHPQQAYRTCLGVLSLAKRLPSVS
jgi:hypothetical protein